MKKILLFMMLILSSFSIFLLSGCGLIPYYQTPKSIIIDDEEYISGFYTGLYLDGLEYQESSSSLFTKKNHHWWYLEESLFDMYYGVHKDALYWRPTLYCRKDQYEEAKNYYHDIDNFEYYFGLYFVDESEIKLNQDINKSMVEKAVSFVINTDISFNTEKYKTTKLELQGKDYIRPTIYRRSKDKLFTTTHRAWIYYEDNLYVHKLTDGSNDITTVYVLEHDVNTYMVGLLKEYGMVD